MRIFDIQQNLQFNIYIENTRRKALLPIVDSIAADYGFLIAMTRGIWSYLFAVKQISNTSSDHIPIQWKRYQMYITASQFNFLYLPRDMGTKDPPGCSYYHHLILAHDIVNKTIKDEQYMDQRTCGFFGGVTKWWYLTTSWNCVFFFFI